MERYSIRALIFLALVHVILFSGCGGDSICLNVPSSPVCDLDRHSLSFGSVTVGECSDLTFTVQNAGGGTLSGTVSETCDEFSIVGPATYNLTAGQSATLTVRFTPSSAGSKSCTIETGAGECAYVSCRGDGCAPAFDDCGRLVQGMECVLFDSDHFGLYVLDEYGSYSVGDYVRVVGDLDPYCYTICMQGDGCIWVDTISECGSM